MEIKRGIPVSSGVAIGPALVVDIEGFRIPRRNIEKKQRKEEMSRLREALKAAAQEARAPLRNPSTPSSANSTAPSSPPTRCSFKTPR